jgi:hypothetical protein
MPKKIVGGMSCLASRGPVCLGRGAVDAWPRFRPFGNPLQTDLDA